MCVYFCAPLTFVRVLDRKTDKTIDDGVRAFAIEGDAPTARLLRRIDPTSSFHRTRRSFLRTRFGKAC